MILAENCSHPGSAPGQAFRAHALKRARYRELWLKRQATITANDHHLPLLGIETHGSFGGRGLPFCKSSIECLSGERTNAILPSRGGRLIVTPPFINRSQTA